VRARVFPKADEPLPFGALVLVRGGRATLADESIANARVVARPSWCRETRIEAGQHFACEMLEDLTGRSLQAMADGPIMDSNRIFLPAGKISEDEWRQRTFEQFDAAGIDDRPELAKRGRRPSTRTT
jgi:hypothetical protein